MKRRVSPVLIVVLLIILVAIAGGVSAVINRYLPGKEKMDSYQYFGVENDSEIALVVDGEALGVKGRTIAGSIYIDEDTVSQYINSRFYWDAEKQQMLYTLPDEVIELEPDSSTYQVGGETLREDEAMILQEDETFYVSLDFLTKYTAMNCQQLENPARVVIRTKDGSTEMVDAAGDYTLRQKGGIKSLILKEGEKGESFYYVEAMDNWTKVVTKDGFMGYIKNDELSEVRTEEIAFDSSIPEYKSIRRDYKINLGWHLMTNKQGNSELANKIEGCDGLNVISPTWFTLADTKGKIRSLASKTYVDEAHAAGLEVWGLIENMNTDVSTLEVLKKRENRIRIIRQLMWAAKKTGMDGINVDLENITEDSAPHYVQLIRELSVACRKNKLVLSVDDPVPQPYNRYYNRKEQGVMADYVIIMGYDEHYAGSEEAGSVASLPFVEDGIRQTLKEVPKEKVINAIPFYTRLWTEPFGSSNISSEAMGMDQASDYIEAHKMSVSWDETVGQYVAEGEDEIQQYRIWVEDERSIEEKMRLIQSYDLAGVAEWQLGYQRNTVWDVISNYLD